MNITPEIKNDLLDLGLSDAGAGVFAYLAIQTSGLLVWVEILVGVSVVAFNVVKMLKVYQELKKNKSNESENN